MQYAPYRNLGKNVAKLYLLVDTEFDRKSALASLLLSAITLSPVNSFSFSQGHFHLGILNRDFLLEGGIEIGPEGPENARSSSSSKFHVWGRVFEEAEGPTPAGGAAERAKGSPLSCERIGAGLPKAESGTLSSSSSKKGSINC